MSFDKTAVIISGGSKGIGLSIAKIFSRKTERPVILIARDREELEKAKEECLLEGASEVHVRVADLTKEEQVKKLNFSGLNPGILINNVGSFLFKPLADTSVEEFEGQFFTNTLIAFNLTKFTLPQLEKQDRALIVNICSQASLRGMGDSGAYSMSKHAALGYTRSLRKELMGSCIAVTAINLGQTYSTSWHDVDIDPNKLIDPEDVGRLIVFLSELSPRSVAEEIILKPQGGEVTPG